MTNEFLIRAACAKNLAKLNALHGTDFLLPPIEFSGRVSKVLGFHQIRLLPFGEIGHTLRFYTKYFAQNSDNFLTEVVPHEVCHFFATKLRILRGDSYFDLYVSRHDAHGKEWQDLMGELGAIARANTPDFAPLNRIPYACSCPGKTHSVSKVVHNRIAKGLKYDCSKCRSQISLKAA